MKQWKTLAITAALLLGTLSGCGGEQAAKAELFAMDTVMTLSFYGEGGEKALGEAEREINRLEALLSRTRQDSEVSRLNAAPAGKTVALDGEVLSLLEKSQDLGKETGGAFDITIAPVASAWGFTEEAYRVPSQEELTGLLAHVGEGQLALNQSGASHKEGAAVDLGGIAKGYASDRVADILEENGVSSAVVSLGGNVYVRGAKEGGKPWQVGIQDPEGEGYLGVLSLSDAFAITSGGYQRYFEENGKRYHHIIDPATGRPAESDLLSVTVVAERQEGGGWEGTRCDAYSTALFVMGEERAIAFWRDRPEDFQLLLVTADGRLLVTEGLARQFVQEKGNDYVYERIE